VEVQLVCQSKNLSKQVEGSVRIRAKALLVNARNLRHSLAGTACTDEAVYDCVTLACVVGVGLIWSEVYLIWLCNSHVEVEYYTDR
jgi:hypothetical protein